MLDSGPTVDEGNASLCESNLQEEDIEVTCSFDYIGDPRIQVLMSWIDAEDHSIVAQLEGTANDSQVTTFSLSFFIPGKLQSWPG